MRYARWIAFITTMSALLFLTSGRVSFQWIGWSLSCVSCLAWAWFAHRDKDTPRMLMEIFVCLTAIVGVYNWVGQV